MDNIDDASISNLTICNNSALSTCAVVSICDYLVSPTGYVWIENNAPGCNSREEVEESCVGVSIENVNPTEEFSLFPNPTYGISDIRYHLSAGKAGISDVRFVTLKLIDLRGKVLKEIVSKKQSAGAYTVRIDGSDLHAGIYLVSLRAGGQVGAARLIVLR